MAKNTAHSNRNPRQARKLRDGLRHMLMTLLQNKKKKFTERQLRDIVTANAKGLGDQSCCWLVRQLRHHQILCLSECRTYIGLAKDYFDKKLDDLVQSAMKFLFPQPVSAAATV